MVVLGKESEDAIFNFKFPKLDKTKDLWMKDPGKVLVLGDGTRQEPWIWRIGLQEHGEGSEKWMIEEDRVRWFKSRALMTRWREEVHMREAEFHRIERAYRRMTDAWTDIAKTADPLLCALRAYAFKRADYYQGRHREATKLHLEVVGSDLARETDLVNPV
ncbi:hypothetical protein M422DRAFT_271991 [Sphaerobolus stellatus SS14]|uniref:Uncharacterized protein n=1 Tax=Sphaerobolus stellatus (strain SS14) TaxID=990650 RepID=A0A0C9TCK2_SPHS4|nr:hypothetical protein M422DRAFT_271991 [Sphaerobolus stellatus SS14]